MRDTDAKLNRTSPIIFIITILSLGFLFPFRQNMSKIQGFYILQKKGRLYVALPLTAPCVYRSDALSEKRSIECHKRVCSFKTHNETRGSPFFLRPKFDFKV